MYNDIERCTNHIDYFATTGNFDNIFGEILYGYSFGHPQRDGILRFSLYFTSPWDSEYYKKYGDPNGFGKQEEDGFKNSVVVPSGKDAIQEVPLQYDDHSPAVSYDCKHGGQFDRVKPKFSEACLNNIYGDNRKRSFFQRLARQNPNQIREVIDRSRLYKVTMELPFHLIKDCVSVDKIKYEGDNEQQINIYTKSSNHNHVESLFKNLQALESMMAEMRNLIIQIRSHPDEYKQKNQVDSWAEKCRLDGFTIENAEFLMDKCKKDVEKMAEVLFQARYFDINAEPKEIKDTKCAHDKCNRVATDGRYCEMCIQLPAKECNHCGKAEP